MKLIYILRIIKYLPQFLLIGIVLIIAGIGIGIGYLLKGK